MKKENNFINAIKKYNMTEFIVYVLINTFAIIILLILRNIPSINPFFDSIYIDVNSRGVVIPSIITVVTLVSSLEFVISQIYFSRRSKIYFRKTLKNVASIIIFSLWALILSFDISEKDKQLVFSCLIFSSVIFVCFFAYDLFSLSTSKLIKKQIDTIIKQIEKGQDGDIKKAENRLITLLLDSLNKDDKPFIEQIILTTPSIVQKILENEFKNTSSDKSENAYVRKALDFVFDIFGISIQRCSSQFKDGITRQSLAACSVISKKVLRYGNESLKDFVVYEIQKLLCSSNEKQEYCDFFAYSLIHDSFEKENNKQTKAKVKITLDEKVDYLYEMFYNSYAYFHDLKSTVFVAAIVEALKDDQFTIDKNRLDKIKEIITLFMQQKIEKEVTICVHYLYYLWKRTYKNEFENECNILLSLFEKENKIKINTANSFTILEVLKRIIKETADIKYELLYIQNAAVVVHILKEKSACDTIEIRKEIFITYFDDFLFLYKEISKNGSSYVFRHYFESLHSFAVQEANDDEVMDKVLELYERAAISLNNVDASEKMEALSDSYFSLIQKLDDDDLIDSPLGEKIITSFIDTVHDLMVCQSKHAITLFEMIDRFGGYTCSYKFILNRKGYFYEILCRHAKDTGILGAEYLNDSIIKIASGFIGWSLYVLVHDNINSYKAICNNSAIQLFKTLIKLGYSQIVTAFVGTLFAVNYAQCISFNENDERHKYAASTIKRINNKEAVILYKSYLLRRNYKEWKYLDSAKYKRGLEKFVDELKINGGIKPKEL